MLELYIVRETNDLDIRSVIQIEFKAAVCPNCGGDLRVPESMKALKCMYCGKDIIVEEAINKAAGPNLNNLLFVARNARTAGNFQEAYIYFTKILELEPMNVEAWLCKGESAGWMSTLANFRFEEMKAGILNAINFSSNEKKNEIKIIGADTINRVTFAFWQLSFKNLDQFYQSDDVKYEFLNRCPLVMKGYETANFLDPKNIQVINNVINFCEVVLKCCQFTTFRRNARGREAIKEYGSVLITIMNDYTSRKEALEKANNHQIT